MLGFFKMFMENGFRRSIYFSTEMLKLMHMGKPSKSWWETCYETLHMDFRNSFYFPASFLSTPVYCGFRWGSSLVHIGYLWGKREEWKNLHSVSENVHEKQSTLGQVSWASFDLIFFITGKNKNNNSSLLSCKGPKSTFTSLKNGRPYSDIKTLYLGGKKWEKR